MSEDSIKKKFLAVYNYGMGGIWFIFLARSEKEITSKYPEFVVMDYFPPPRQLGAETYKYLTTLEIRDIDAPPTGALAKFLEARD